MPKNAPEDEDWAAVDRAVKERMRERAISIGVLARKTRLSETTIRYIGDPAGNHHKSALVALSAVLDWPHDYLLNILHGEPEKNALVTSPAEARLEDLLLAEVGAMKEEVAGLRDIIQGIDRKIDVIIEAQRSPGSDAQSA